jgi:hypothetical protein
MITVFKESWTLVPLMCVYIHVTGKDQLRTICRRNEWNLSLSLTELTPHSATRIMLITLLHWSMTEHQFPQYAGLHERLSYIKPHKSRIILRCPYVTLTGAATYFVVSHRATDVAIGIGKRAGRTIPTELHELTWQIWMVRALCLFRNT